MSAESPSLPAALAGNPRVSTWIRFIDDRVVVHTGKVELGQGISTAIAMIAAEELQVDIEQVEVITGRTDQGPNEFITAGSMSVEGSGSAVRVAAAEARGLLLERAAAVFDLPTARLTVDRGVITHPDGNERTSYWELTRDDQLDQEFSGRFSVRSVTDYRLVGRTTARLDLASKIHGEPSYIQDHTEVRHARVVRPPDLNGELRSVDTKPVAAMPGITDVIRDGSFLAVLATSETAAERAREKLVQTAVWTRQALSPVADDLPAYLRDNVGFRLLVENGTPTDTPVPDLIQPEGTRLSATFVKPYHLHGSIAPSAARARFSNGHLTVFSHSQGPSILQHALAGILDFSPDDITVIHEENAGCYGHNGADDAAMDAALIATHCPDTDILLKWLRSDEHQWEPRSPAMVVDLDATLVDGQIAAWNADIYSQSHMGRPSPVSKGASLIAAWHKSNPLSNPVPRPGRAPHGGIHRNADPYYRIGAKRITKNLVTDRPVRTSSTRALGAFANVFAIETFMDELAHAAGQDPVAFRLAHLEDNRARAVIERAWSALTAFEHRTSPPWKTGRGIAFSRYKNSKTFAAVGMVVAVHEESAEARLIHGVIAADAGQIIDRDGLANQLEGGLIQAASWTMKEEITFHNDRQVSDWDDYPILTFSEVPTVEVVLLDRPDEPSLGAGEATHGPTPAAISNALYDATGIRVRTIPFTPGQLRAAAAST